MTIPRRLSDNELASLYQNGVLSQDDIHFLPAKLDNLEEHMAGLHDVYGIAYADGREAVSRLLRTIFTDPNLDFDTRPTGNDVNLLVAEIAKRLQQEDEVLED